MDKNCTCREVAPGIFEVKTPVRTIMLDGREINAILEFFKERRWESGLRNAIAEYIDDDISDERLEEMVAEGLDEIRSREENYGEFIEQDSSYKDVIDYLFY